MRSLTLACRDDDRTSVICAIRAMAAHHYDLDVCVVKSKTPATMKRCFSTARRNTYEIATIEYPAAKRLNPLTLWDLHWSKAWTTRGYRRSGKRLSF
jgi:hypothetical protein